MIAIGVMVGRPESKPLGIEVSSLVGVQVGQLRPPTTPPLDLYPAKIATDAVVGRPRMAPRRATENGAPQIALDLLDPEC